MNKNKQRMKHGYVRYEISDKDFMIVHYDGQLQCTKYNDELSIWQFHFLTFNLG